jgi:hypothetical protein
MTRADPIAKSKKNDPKIAAPYNASESSESNLPHAPIYAISPKEISKIADRIQ